MSIRLDQVMNLIDSLGIPAKMSKEMWLEFLEEIIEACEYRAVAIREELEHGN